MHASRLVSSPGLEWLRRLSRRAWWLHALLIGQLALLPCPLSRGVWVEVDTDGDGLVDSGYEDGVSEGFAEDTQALAEPDADGDGLTDVEEAALASDPHNPDSDSDGLTDADEVRLSGTSPLLADSDGDGISDYNAFYGNTAVDTLWAGEGATAYDWDGDGLHDPVDPDPYSAQNIGDADGDHVPDPEDSHPLDPTLWCDSNGNGVNDDAEVDGADFDGDGVSDATDSHPADPNLDNDWNDNGVDDEHEDGDGDGVSNLQDSHPNSNSLWCDWNGNGVNDDAEAAVAAGHAIAGSVEESSGEEPADSVMQDQDGDGYGDDRDSHPADPGLWNDHNGNGRNDDEEAPADTDRDGIPDALDAAPADQDNDGLTDTEEWTLGTNPAEADSDGDGLSDGEEVYAGTDPWSVDTDGDGLTDSEELFAYHTDPLEPTAIAPPETAAPPETESMPATETAVLRVSHLVPDPGSETGQRRVEHPDGGRLAFPSKSALKSRADLTKTLTVTNGSATTLSGLSVSLSGPDAAHFRLGSLANTDLAPGAERTLAVTFLAPTPTTDARSATLTLHGGEPAMPLFVLNLRSVVSSGLWTTHDDHFFADYTDSDGDGIPDLVEAMYAPLEVTASGDLDGDGTSNLDQYLAGRDLRDRAKSTDTDGDGLTNATEDAWSAAYPGKLNKYYFADAYADPDGDGLLTIEELNCLWGSDKDPQAVATHPFVAGSPPPSASKTATYKTTSRKPPRTAPASAAGETASGPLAARAGLHAAWMNDGQLRRACRETARANGGKLPADFFTPECVVHAATATLQKTQGSDHLPRGYLLWLGRQSPAITLPAPAPAMPDSEAVQSQLKGLCLPDASDADADAMPTAWEAAYDLNWRSPADSHLRYAIETLDQRLASLASNAVDLIQTAEQEAVAEVRNRLLAAQTAWPAITYPATLQNQTQTVQSHLVPVYAVDRVKYPASLSAAAAADATRRSAWIAKFTAALHWQMLAGFDPDHDGLMNQDEYQQGLSPHLPDYEATGERDSDGDGFIDAIELATGTDHLDTRKRPVYAVDILTPVKERTGTTLQPLTLPMQTGLRGPTGLWPLGTQSLTVSAPDTQCLLAWGQDHAAVDWHPKTVPVGVTNDQGRITLHVHPGWKKGGLRLTFRSTPGAGLPAGLKPVRVTCDLKITAPTEDSDTDGLPDAWEARRALGPGDPAHSLSQASALDAEAGPQHFGYHPSTPTERLPEVVQALLNEWKAVEADLGYLPEYPVTSATLTPLAVPTSVDTVTAARHKILAMIDPDHDGWSNRVEWENGTHPQVPDNPATAARDTDGDEIADVLEHQEGTNPFDAGSVPVLSLADVNLRVVWGADQSAASGALASQPIVMQVARANGVLLKHVALKASCLGGHFAVPASAGRNVQWLANELPLVTDAQGKAVFHFWTPVGASTQWQIRVRLTAHPTVESRFLIYNAGTRSGGTSGSSPGSSDRRLNNGDNPGFNNSHAPFVIRFKDWQGGTISYEQANASGGPAGTGRVAYTAIKQRMQWELGGGGVPRKVPNGNSFEDSIGSHSTESAQEWMEEWNRTAPQPYIVKRYTSQWIEGAADNGVYAESFLVKDGVEQLQDRTLDQAFGSEEDYENYMNSPRADQYDVDGGSWEEVSSVFPSEENGSGTTNDPQDDPRPATKYYYQQQVPQTFTTVETDLDLTKQETTDPVGRLNSLGATIRMKDKRLHNGQRRLADGEYDWDGIVARSSMQLTKVEPAESGGTPAYSGQRSQGKVVIAWDNDYPVSLSEKSREAWLKRFLVLVSHPDGTDTLKPLSDYLSLTSGGDSAPIELNPGTLNDETTPEKSVTLRLLPIDLAIDANRDGTIDQGETASEDRPFRFWINNDDDPNTLGDDVELAMKKDELSPPGFEDWRSAPTLGHIDGVRDLEDFTRLHLTLPEDIVQKAKAGKVQVGFKWTNGSGPRIRAYKSQGDEGDEKYLFYQYEADLQVDSDHQCSVVDVKGSQTVFLPSSYWQGVASGTTKMFFVFEGCEKGTAELTTIIKVGSSAETAAAGVWIKLMDVQEMFERAKVNEPMSEPGHVPDPWDTTEPAMFHYIADPNGNPPDRDPDETKQYIIHVHGWRMSYAEAQTWANTTFKRLWHLGYKGRFAFFSWPTFSGATSRLNGYMTYNKSEYRAWLSGAALKSYVASLPGSYTKSIMAHSMGNVVAGSAFRKGMQGVSHYALLNAAMASQSYDPNLVDLPMRQTPDTDSEPSVQLKFGLSGKFSGITSSVTNFYLEDDFATTIWSYNHTFNKPQAFLNEVGGIIPLGRAYGYSIDGWKVGGARHKLVQLDPFVELLPVRGVTMVEEAMAFVSQTRSLPAGRTPTNLGLGGWQIDMDTYVFENNYRSFFGSEHSAQWIWSFQRTFGVWRALLNSFDIMPNPVP